ncbi:winged helix-turn-helix transcriptional regulator [Alterisphingorhabdus coralli]|uniref:Helix-turn-helix domain-containing protein n=1 Tax=Alterisphingorhabdus coralli TaxID=3071408 RepID=A0AA97I1Y4_9SPHN|nr:helix-turn-helix domain-containing protein [Parasphingorhabdus sp. SCSIO 66989]WOE75215.1 helix-turn-helix domain-containing protein [Parasphingorhabdus sp. SCSIO 66989]
MQPKSFADMQCSIARTLEMIGPWWSFLIIRDAFMGVRRFRDFERSLGIAKNTLTKRLNQLVDAGLLQKAPASDGSKYAEYQLTQKGRELFPVILSLTQWGDKWAEHEDGRTFMIIDKRNGEEIVRQEVHDAEGRLVPSSAIGVRRA